MSVVSSFFIEFGQFWCDDSPSLRRFSKLHGICEKARVLGVLDEEKLLNAAATHLRRMILVALYTGLRRGEILHQLWEHVDFDLGVLYVSRSKTAGGEGREVPLGTVARQVLWPIRKEKGHVFEFHGAPIGSYKTAWLRAVRDSLPYHLRFHDLRHTANSRMMEAGVIQDVRKAILGHSSGREINARYTHVELPAKREAIRKLELWVEEQRNTLRAQRDEKGGNNGCTETRRKGTRLVPGIRTQAMGEEITSGCGPGTARQTEEESGRDQGRAG